ncbi:class II glutamine amidotransferase [Nocardioides massiliensis]|uniref:Glutamine amidotransferase n=1 Tax=Nocardioides massiliensis TaxID=1325935 RepID=A0ABT9NUJ6_9ACTN|nr:class II glutamine amidotransferase [Nocardioides massiliensis]MDP9823981.1 putative glutamine amidotransferase [Nocardioides massiliensis]
MCRLLGYVSDRPRAVADLLGEDGVESFTSLTAVHADGWGMAWRDEDAEATRTATSPRTAATDDEYQRLVRQPLAAAGLVHLRWATGGLPVRPENTHPFFEDGYAFAHNGHVSPISRIEALLTRESRSALIGDTDSERYFRFVLQCMREDDNEVGGFTRALGTMIQRFPHSSLNALMLTPERMYAIHINSKADSPLRALRELFDDEDDIPDRHTDEYFAMDYRVTDDSIQIVSSGLDEPGWDPVPADTAVMIDLGTREVTRLDPIISMAD